MIEFLKFVENGEQLHLDETEQYAVILGEQPSQGAKSPTLWNAAFEALHVPARMHPMDVASEHLAVVINALRNDPRCLGGAVTMPYKQKICESLDDLEEEACVIGAVNCFYKKDTKLIGANTDGAGALACLLKEVDGEQSLQGKTILLIGFGGAGKAVAVYFAKAIGSTGTLIIANRTKEALWLLTPNIARYCQVATTELPAEHEIIAKADVIVNCSSVGFRGARTNESGTVYLDAYTPLGTIPEQVATDARQGKRGYVALAKNAIIQNYRESIEALLQSKKEVLIFDIIYQPKQTLLLRIADTLALRTLNGEGMNLEQAVIAFVKSTQSLHGEPFAIDEIRTFMKTAW